MKYDDCMTCFVKFGEYNLMSADKDPSTSSKRARCIFNPDDVVKAIGGWVSYNMMRGLKTFDEPFYVGDLDL